MLIRSRRAFTLLELMVAFIIMAILSAIAVPSLLGVVNGDQLTADATSAGSIVDAAYYTAASGAALPDGSPSYFPIDAAEVAQFVPAGTDLVTPLTSGSPCVVGDPSSYAYGLVDCTYGDPTDDVIITYTDGDTIYVSAAQGAGDGTPTVLGGTSLSGGVIGEGNGDSGGGAGTTTTTAPTTTTTAPTTTTTAPPVVGTVIDSISTLAASPQSIASDGTDVWLTDFSNNDVIEVDIATQAVVNTITVGSEPYDVAADGSHVWVTNFGSGTVSEIDASTATVIHTITVGNGPVGIAADGTHVWVTNSNDGTVSEIDAATATVVNTITVGSNPYAIAAEGTHVWVVNSNDGTVSEIDAATATVVNTITVGSNPLSITADSADVWVGNTVGFTISKIDASTGAVLDTFSSGNNGYCEPLGLYSDNTTLWVSCADGWIDTFSSVTDAPDAPIGVGGSPGGVTGDGAHVWVFNGNDGTIYEVLPS